MRLRFGTILVAAAAASCAAGAAPAEFFVSPTGDDSAAGTFKAPFASPARASAAVRDLKKAGPLPKGGVVVWLRGGTYPLRAAWTLGKEDSGAPDAPVAYRAWKDERPVLSGGWTIPASAWRKADNPRIPAAARGKVWAADVKALGFDGLDPRRPLRFRHPQSPVPHPLPLPQRQAAHARAPSGQRLPPHHFRQRRYQPRLHGGPWRLVALGAVCRPRPPGARLLEVPVGGPDGAGDR